MRGYVNKWTFLYRYIDMWFKRIYDIIRGGIMVRGEKYNYRKEIGKGGFSKIELYQNGEKERIVVKKITNKESIEKEYEMGVYVNSKYMIETIDIIRGGYMKGRGIVLEYVEGIELYEYVTRHSTIEIKKGYKQIIEGVRYMHERGVAHMDLKLENIMINLDTGVIKIIDLGQANRFIEGGEYKYETRIAGTVPYIPPEVYRRYYRGDRYDIWSCGIILYTMKYRRMPWHETTERDKRYMKYRETGRLGIEETRLGRLIYGMLEINEEWRIDIREITNIIEIL